MIIAIAGRRVDAPDAKERHFPASNVERVRTLVREMLEREKTTVLVCSAACGADLIALEAAGSLKMRRIIVLPFERERFKETSVVDRPGNWGPLYDRIVDEVERGGDLITLKDVPKELAYRSVNIRILDEGQRLAEERLEKVEAALIWNRESRGVKDVTEAFGAEARKRGLKVLEVSTLAE